MIIGAVVIVVADARLVIRGWFGETRASSPAGSSVWVSNSKNRQIGDLAVFVLFGCGSRI